VKLGIDYLLTIKDIRRRRKSVDQFPTAIYDAYERLLDRDEGNKEFALEILSWIYYAQRSLTIDEIIHAIAITGTTELDSRDLNDAEIVIACCQGLAVVDNGRMRFVHPSTVEAFLKKQGKLQMPCKIATVCLTYLGFDVFAEGLCSSTSALNQRVDKYKFGGYAAKFWQDHAIQCLEEGPEIYGIIQSTFNSVQKRESMLQLKRNDFYQENRSVQRMLQILGKSDDCEPTGKSLLHLFVEYEKLLPVMDANGFSSNHRAVRAM
jgi:hypothetical protein